jgi:hypothetical protein
MHIRKVFFIVLVSVLISPLLSYRTANNEWILVNVDSVASAQFPGQPTSQTINGVKAYFVRTQEVLFMVMVINQENQLDKTSQTNIYSFYLGFIDSMIRETKSTLTDSASFNLDKCKGIDFSYVGPLPDGGKANRKSRAVLIRNKLYCWGYTVFGQETESSKASTKRFIESFSVK